jgi:signal transduction histidine kinase
MHAVGIYLIYAAVVVRGLVRLPNMERPGQVVALLALYGLLLIIGTWRTPWRPARPVAPEITAQATGRPLYWQGLTLAYLLLECGLVVALLLNHEVQDFYALLFIPLSLQAVLFLGRPVGFLCITVFALAMTGPLLVSQEGWAFGLAMVLNYGGLCFLFGGYAHQVRMAESARSHNMHMLGELQVAHCQLQGYAAQKEDLAAEQERNRLARELHDSVTQTVFGMTLAVQTARLLLERDKTRVADQLTRLEELAANAMREIQAQVSQLHPRPVAYVGEEGLPAALRGLAAERLARDGLQVNVEVVGERSLTEQVAANLYCIAQEALTNVVKHAGTLQATLRLQLGEGSSCLEVEDGGLGFDLQAAGGQRGHLGLAGMAERAEELGWKLSIESRPGHGTRVRVDEISPGDEG